MLTLTNVHSYQAPTKLSVLGPPMHNFVTDVLSALGYEPPVHHLERRWTMGELRENPADTALQHDGKLVIKKQDGNRVIRDIPCPHHPFGPFALAFGSHRRPPHPPTARQRWRQAQSPWRGQGNVLDKVALRAVAIEQEKLITGL